MPTCSAFPDVFNLHQMCEQIDASETAHMKTQARLSLSCSFSQHMSKISWARSKFSEFFVCLFFTNYYPFFRFDIFT